MHSSQQTARRSQGAYQPHANGNGQNVTANGSATHHSNNNNMTSSTAPTVEMIANRDKEK